MTATQLSQKECKPCRGGEEPLKGEPLLNLSKQLNQGWEVINGHHLKKTYSFDDFRQALEFTKRVGELAEAEGHHPDIYLTWGKVELLVWTHKIDGLTESDFIFAAKADEAL